MTQPYVNFLSYNSTGLSDAKIKWINDLLMTTNASFIELQEHYRKSKTIDDLFMKNFPTNKCNVKPGFRADGQLHGRPKGGLAQLINKKLSMKIKNINIDNFRIQAQVLEFPTSKLLWLNAYFPTDSQLVNFDDAELLNTLKDIEKVMDDTEYDDVILGGDLNWDNRRDSGFSQVMRDFTSRIGLKSVWEKFQVGYTHIHTDLKSTSILDNFLVNERLLDLIEDAGVIHLGDNLSRHSPIMIKLKIGAIPLKPDRREEPKARRPAWYKATTEDIDEYTEVLDEHLGNLMYPESLFCTDVHCTDQQHRQDRDDHVLDVLTSLVESSFSAVPLSKTSRPRDSSSRIPGWKDHVEPFRQDSLFWHSVWLSADKPNTGQLFQLMCWSRNKYHYAIRKLKKQSDKVMAENLMEAAKESEVDLLKEMKRVKCGKLKGQSMPDEIDGVSEPDEILVKFREVYEELYNSADSSDAMNVIKEKLAMVIDHDSFEEVNKINSKTIKLACEKLKPGKMDVSGGYASDCLLHAPDSLYEHLAMIFRSFLVHGDVTSQLLCCAFLPLYKGGHKSASKTDSYRAIAGSSQLLKLFDNVILLLWGHLLTSDSLQFGYKCGTSTTQCTWLVREVADFYVQRGTPIIGVTLDCSKAFDKCLFDKLFQKLIDRKVPAIVVRVLAFVYEEQLGCVKLQEKRSDQFRIINGTRQGSVLSPTLFALYLDGLLQQLRDLGVGCHLGGWWYGAVCFADDLFLLAPSRTAAAMMLETCEQYALQHNLMFSTDPNPAKSKSKCIYFTGKARNVILPDPLQLFGEDLPWVNSAEHLGHTLHKDCTMDQDARQKRAQFIDKTSDLRTVFDFAHPEQVIKAGQVYASDAYGFMLYDLKSKASQSYFKSWNTFVKLAWNVPLDTSTYLVENTLAGNFLSLRKQIYSRYVKFFQQLFSSSSKEVRHLVRIVARDARSTVWKNIKHIEEVSGLSPWDYSNWRILEKIQNAAAPANDEWRMSFLLKLLKIRLQKSSALEDTENLTQMIDSLCNS